MKQNASLRIVCMTIVFAVIVSFGGAAKKRQFRTIRKASRI